MIKSVGQSISSPIELAKLREGGKTKTAASVESSVDTGASAETTATPAARMAAQGAPVDMDRIAAVKAAIASGKYPVDPERIAEKMIALDLPGQD